SSTIEPSTRRRSGPRGTARRGLGWSQVLLEERDHAGLVHAADLPRDLFALLHHDQRRHVADLVADRDGLGLVDVDLADPELALVFLGDLVDDRRDGFAGAAPGGRKVEQHGRLGVHYVGLETVVRHMHYAL